MFFDNFVFWGLAFISIFLLQVINDDNIILTLFLFVCLYLFDSGHVYLTYIRVVKEFKYAKLFFIITPLLVFLFLYYITTYIYTLFFYVIGYTTLFHFIRQIYGINRWYLSISNEKITQLRDNVIYLVTVIPMLILFFKQPMIPFRIPCQLKNYIINLKPSPIYPQRRLQVEKVLGSSF